jgi:hypothetical protein
LFCSDSFIFLFFLLSGPMIGQALQGEVIISFLLKEANSKPAPMPTKQATPHVPSILSQAGSTIGGLSFDDLTSEQIPSFLKQNGLNHKGNHAVLILRCFIAFELTKNGLNFHEVKAESIQKSLDSLPRIDKRIKLTDILFAQPEGIYKQLANLSEEERNCWVSLSFFFFFSFPLSSFSSIHLFLLARCRLRRHLFFVH